MTRADLLKEAITDGLIELKRKPELVEIVDRATFQEDKFGRVIAYAPRQRLSPNTPAQQYVVLSLRDGIEEGLRVHEFLDPIIIEP